MHNALQGDDLNLSDRKKKIYEDVVYENAIRNHLDHNMVIVHDPQPLLLIRHYSKSGPWVWRCHVDISEPGKGIWDYLRGFIEQYDTMIVSIDKYKKSCRCPNSYSCPPSAIFPLATAN